MVGAFSIYIKTSLSQYAMLSAVFTVFAVLIFPVLSTSNENYTEELLIKPLYSKQVYVYFHFVTTLDTNPETETFRHTHLFPRALGEIVSKFQVQELQLSLTNGLWRYENWGYPVEHAAPGAELWAWFKPTTQDVNKNWKGLAESLSGLLCASLNFIGDINSIGPEYSFRPRGAVPGNQQINSSYVRYATLPREIVCTENLTPWKKQLPCGGNSGKGLAALLNAGYVHTTRYHSLSIRLRPVCRTADCSSAAYELQQSVSLLYDHAETSDGKDYWSFRNLFGQGVLGACPLAKSTTVYVDTTSNASVPFNLAPQPQRTLSSVRGGHVTTFAVYDVHKNHLSIAGEYVAQNAVLVVQEPILVAHQYQQGFGQEYGGIVVNIYNNHWSHLDVVVLQSIPWYVPIFLHTLKATTNGREVAPVKVFYKPGRQRERPYHLEVLLRLPPRSFTALSVDFDYVFLKWQEYPPDANHGFYIGSAVVSAALPLARNFTGLPQDGSRLGDCVNASRSNYLVQVRTESLLITLPTPDFSMPYNVICLACTVVALAFGPLHNITTKRLVLSADNNDKFGTKVIKKALAWLKKSDKRTAVTDSEPANPKEKTE